MTTLIIDDEKRARTELHDILDTRYPEITVLGEAGDVTEALQKIESLAPDLLFLDIEMPGGTGFDLVSQLPEEKRPEIIFVSGRKEYGLQAFRSAALDYLTKPVVNEELAEAIQRAEERVRQKASEVRLETILQNLEERHYGERKITIPNEREAELVALRDIIYCKGETGYTRIFLVDGSSRLSAYSLGQYQKMLPEPYFFATHRSYIVHRTFVSGTPRNNLLRLRNGDEVPVSRMKKDGVRNWIADGN